MEKFFHRQHVDPSKLPPVLVEKWSAAALKEGFVPFPKTLMRCLQLLFPDNDGMKELSVLLAIVDFRRPKAFRLPSEDFLAYSAGLSAEDFASALSRLEKKRFISVERLPEGLKVSCDGLLNSIENLTTLNP